MNKPLLIIGRPNSSKTVFMAQLYSRLQKRKSKLILDKAVGDLSPIKAARESLAYGNEPESSHGSKSEKMLLSSRYENLILDLICPEYGGEQIDNILSKREVNSEWREAINNSDNWIFFIRLTSISHSEDLTTTTVSKDHIKNNNKIKETEYTISDQSALIELLQIMMDAKATDYHFKNNKIKLTVVLTCWDELKTQDLPKEILKKRLPLLLNFIKANWELEKIRILGLSAQGFSLEPDENKKKYQINGPEEYGYVIKQDGTKTNDITELIIEALF